MNDTVQKDASEPGKRAVLLVDDDRFLLDMYTMKFIQSGYVARGFLSVNEGLEALRKGFAPDAIVFDLIMPGKDGFAFLTALRDEKLAEKTLKIALTNQSDESDQAHAKELGADKCCVKATMIPSEVVSMVSSEIVKRSTK